MKITGKRTLWEGKFLRTAELQYVDRTGMPRNWEIVERTTADGVVIIAAVTTDMRAILIRQYRPALDSYVIELPAGLIDPGEPVHEACRRELIEETAYTSDKITTLSSGVISTGVLTESWHPMLVRDAVPASEEELAKYPPDETEDIEVIFVDLKDAYSALSALEAGGNKVDIRIYGILELARRTINEGER